MSANNLQWRAAAAVILGLFTGIFFGPFCMLFVQPIADAFSMLLQMAAFPYLCLSVIHGLGTVLPKDARRLFKCGLPFLIGIWILIYAVIFFLSHLVPNPVPSLIDVSASKSSTEIIESILEALTFENAFTEFANGVVLASVVLSLFFGFGLMKSEKKEIVNAYLEKGLQIFERIFRWIIAISPIGIFANLSILSGTFHFHFEFFWMSKVAISFFVVFLILPPILAYFIGLKWRDFLNVFQNVCLIPILAGSLMLLIPFLVFYFQGRNKEETPALQIAIPIIYCFGPIGSSIAYFDVVYLSYFYRIALPLLEKIYLSILFIPHTLGDPKSFIPSFLIEQFHLPKHALEVHREGALLSHYFITLMSVTGIFTLLLLIFSAREKKKKRAVFFLGGVSALFVAGALSSKPLFHFSDYYEDLYQNLSINDVITTPVAAKIFPPGETGTPRNLEQSRFGQILASGVLKVGMDLYEIPYSYLNASNQLVGYDIAYAYQLARELDCTLEFIAVDPKNIAEALNRGDCDLGMSSYIMTEKRLTTMNFSQPYQEENTVLVIPRTREAEFLNLDAIIKRSDLTILAGGAYIPFVKRYFPHAKLFASPNLDLLIKHQVDSCLWSSHSGFVWCLSNPEFMAIDYGALLEKSYLGYPLHPNSLEFADFLNNWLQLKEQTGFKQAMVEYWIEGQTRYTKAPRWSILRNVLGIGN